MDVLLIGALAGAAAVETLHQIAWALGRGRHRAQEAAYAERFRQRYLAYSADRRDQS